nr:hypothetical protein [Ruminococcus sp. 1001713B170207_170306_F5]
MIISDFFSGVKDDQRFGFLNEWNEKRDHRERRRFGGRYRWQYRRRNIRLRKKSANSRKKQNEGLPVCGGRLSSVVSIRTTMRKCTATAKKPEERT